MLRAPFTSRLAGRTRLVTHAFCARYQTAPPYEGPTEGIPPPLKGIKIVDLSRVLAGPVASMLLADLGEAVPPIWLDNLGHISHTDNGT